MLSRAETTPVGAGVTVGLRIGVGTVVGLAGGGVVASCSAAAGGGAAAVGGSEVGIAAALPQPIAPNRRKAIVPKTSVVGRHGRFLECMTLLSDSNLQNSQTSQAR